MKSQLKIRTEYSFRYAYGHTANVIDYLKSTGCKTAAITDRSSTFGHIVWSKLCKQAGIKPIFGVEIAFTPDINFRGKRQELYYLSLIARNNAGLREIYSAVEEATANFYYLPRLPIVKLWEFSNDILLLSGNSGIGIHNNQLPPRVIVEAHPATNPSLLRLSEGTYLPVSDNYMITPDNREAYEVLIGRTAFNRPSPMHILTKQELLNECSYLQDIHFEAADRIADECNAVLLPATNIKSSETRSLLDLCIEGAGFRGIELVGQYKERMLYELGLIEQKGFADYFKVIMDLVNYAKQHMLVGPARGSSCGSLVCYLLGITDVDPIPHGLIFERFIDVTRNDFPDVDLDFSDNKREMVLDYLITKYGPDKVAKLGTVSRYKARSAIGETAKAVKISTWEAEQIADSIVTRNDGDERADYCIIDSLLDTDIPTRYPSIMVAAKLEAHARHAGTHAAGIVITNEPLVNFVAKDVHSGRVMLDKFDCEAINLMKIDALGLRTLSIIADCLDQIGWTKEQLLAHSIDEDDAYRILRLRLFSGIFQFTGKALQGLVRKITVDKFTDITAITALARPGPLVSGASYEWCARREGKKPVEYLHPMLEKITSETYGLVIYQEQVMQVAREIGLLSWPDTMALRKGMGKTLGQEYMDQYKEKFIAGAFVNNIEDVIAKQIWEQVNSFGGYAFNRCLSGNTKVIFASPNRYVSKEVTIEQLYQMYVVDPSPSLRKKMQVGFRPSLVSLFPDGRCYPQSFKSIVCNGKMEVYDYEFNDGIIIRCTPLHKFFVNGEWIAISEARIGDEFLAAQYEGYKKIGREGSGSAAGKTYGIRQKSFPSGDLNPSWDNGRTPALQIFKKVNIGNVCEDCGNDHRRMEIHHVDESRGFSEPNNLMWLCPSCHKKRHYSSGRIKRWEKGYETFTRELVSIKYAGEEITYDIEMPEHHNFVLGNGIITHNSHAVAYALVTYWCLVLKAKYPLQFALANLKYTSDPDSVKHILREVDRMGYKFKTFDLDKSKYNWSVQDETLIGGLINVKGIGDKTARDIVTRKSNEIPLTDGQVKKLANATTAFDNVFEARTRFADLLNNPASYGIVSRLWNITDIEEVEGTYVFLAKVVSWKQRSLNETKFLKERGGLRVPNDRWLTMLLEDDTDTIPATISRYNFPRFGMPMMKEKLGNWYLFRGKVMEGNRRIYLEKWKTI